MKKLALILVLALILLALGATVSADAPWYAQLDRAQRIQDINFIHHEERDNIIHLRHHPEPLLLDASNPLDADLLFGFEWGNPDITVEELQAWIYRPEHVLNVSIDGGDAFSVKEYYQPAFWAEPGVGPVWTWDHDADGLGNVDGDIWEDWSGPIVFFRWSWSTNPAPGDTHTFEFWSNDGTPEPLHDFMTVIWE